MSTNLRTCLRDPIPEIFDAARYLDEAVTAHLRGRSELDPLPKVFAPID
jgi:hypothetical protein